MLSECIMSTMNLLGTRESTGSIHMNASIRKNVCKYFERTLRHFLVHVYLKVPTRFQCPYRTTWLWSVTCYNQRKFARGRNSLINSYNLHCTTILFSSVYPHLLSGSVFDGQTRFLIVGGGFHLHGPSMWSSFPPTPHQISCDNPFVLFPG